MALRNRGASWRRMAEEARTIAAGMHDDAKQTMLEIAERFEILAAYCERQAKKASSTPRMESGLSFAGGDRDHR